MVHASAALLHRQRTHAWLRRHAHRAYDAIVIGGGVVGAAVANKLSDGGAKRVLVLEKEVTVGTHQTGHGGTSGADGRAGGAGVLHSGRAGEGGGGSPRGIR